MAHQTTTAGSEMIDRLLVENLDVILWLVGSFLVIASVFSFIWLKVKENESKCDCPPTIIKSHDGGFVVKTFHLPLCRLRKKEPHVKQP
jgi:hypothetical protein